jgi:hypothetical protein
MSPHSMSWGFNKCQVYKTILSIKYMRQNKQPGRIEDIEW